MKHYFQCILAGLILFEFMNECVAAGKIISPEMSILFRIVDDAGNPVPNVSCRGWIRQFDVKGGGRSYSLTSDANGVVAINAKCSVSFTAFFSKEGYYMSRLEPCLDADGAGSAVVDGKWQPYGETRTVVLKKIRNPGALKVPQSLIRLEVDVPAYGEWLPFDLERFDWVAPRGSGSRDDVLLRFRRRVTEKWNDFKYEMDVTFTNNPYAGVVAMKKDVKSNFTTAYNADPGADYKPTLHFFLERTPKGGSKSFVLDKDSYLVFRTRTTVDSEGKLKTAHYGTIHGDWMPGKKSMSFADGCFNPTPNDTNIEDGHQLREILRNER